MLFQILPKSIHVTDRLSRITW